MHTRRKVDMPVSVEIPAHFRPCSAVAVRSGRNLRRVPPVRALSRRVWRVGVRDGGLRHAPGPAGRPVDEATPRPRAPRNRSATVERDAHSAAGSRMSVFGMGMRPTGRVRLADRLSRSRPGTGFESGGDGLSDARCARNGERSPVPSAAGRGVRAPSPANFDQTVDQISTSCTPAPRAPGRRWSRRPPDRARASGSRWE